MTQKDKQLLLKDLCARLPYGVIIEGLEHLEIMTVKHLTIISVMSAEPYKPYLRSRSSMTIDELKHYHDLCAWNDVEYYEFGEWTTKIVYNDTWESIDYLNSIHVDYRGLIPMGLAIEVTEDNNPYRN